MAKKVIGFIGSSNLKNEVENSLVRHFPLSDFSLIKIPLKGEQDLGEAFSQIFDCNADVLFMEFDKITPKIINFLLLLKAHRSTKATPIIGQFSDKKSLIEARGMFPYGTVYSFMKGMDLEELILDVHYFTYDEVIDLPRYALAERLNINASIASMAEVSYLTPDYIGLELDLSLIEDFELPINFNFFNGFKNEGFRVALTSPQPPRNYFMHTVELEIIEGSGWEEGGGEDDAGNDSYRLDYPSWLDMTKDEFGHKDINILMIDSRASSFSKFIDEFDSQNTFVKFVSHVDPNMQLITEFCPDIIMYQLEVDNDDEEEEEEETQEAEGEEPRKVKAHNNDKHMLKKIVGHIRTVEDYNPFIFVFNTMTESDKLRKTLTYNNIVAHPKIFDIGIVPVLTDRFRKSKKGLRPAEKYYMAALDPRAQVEIPMNIIITSITEHEVSFIYDGPLPYFSTYKLEFSTPVFITIVPTIRNLEFTRQGTHYMGFINGADEMDKKELRKLVNFILATSPKDLKNIQLKNLIAMRKKAEQLKISNEMDDEDVVPGRGSSKLPPKKKQDKSEASLGRAEKVPEGVKKRRPKGASKL